MSSAKITTWIANSLFIFFIENYLSISWKYCGTLDTSIFGIKNACFLFEIPVMKYLLWANDQSLKTFHFDKSHGNP